MSAYPDNDYPNAGKKITEEELAFLRSAVAKLSKATCKALEVEAVKIFNKRKDE